MRIFIITQNEPFYLKSNIEFLIKNLNSNTKIVGCALSAASPFGKKESFFIKFIKTVNIFGIRFVLYYSFQYLKSLLFNNSVKSTLIKNKIPTIKLGGSINNKLNLDLISQFRPDLLVSILGNQIFKKPLIDLAPKGCINLHTALLPKYRGLMPTFWVLKNNEEYTGVSVFFVDEGIDSGPIIVQRKIKIGNQTQRQLISNTKKLGMECILEAIELIVKDKVRLIANPETEQTYYSFPTRKDVLEFNQAKKKFF